MVDFNQAIKDAKYVTFMTGAGVSTPSGIPDYRSETGIYSGKSNGEQMLSHEEFVQHPQEFWDFCMKNLYFPKAKPNIIHQKMAEITNKKGTVITQNVDGLDRQAGTQNLVEFHGDLYDVYCTKCGKNVDWHEYMKDYHHQDCGGILRGTTVLYGESIAEDSISRSIDAIQKADLIVVVGTSFKVYPFAGLIQYRNPQAKLISINKVPQQFSMPVESIVGDAEQVFKDVEV